MLITYSILFYYSPCIFTLLHKLLTTLLYQNKNCLWQNWRREYSLRYTYYYSLYAKTKRASKIHYFVLSGLSFRYGVTSADKSFLFACFKSHMYVYALYIQVFNNTICLINENEKLKWILQYYPNVDQIVIFIWNNFRVIISFQVPSNQRSLVYNLS